MKELTKKEIIEMRKKISIIFSLEISYIFVLCMAIYSSILHDLLFTIGLLSICVQLITIRFILKKNIINGKE